MTFRYKCVPCSERKGKDVEFDFMHIPRDSKAQCPDCASIADEKVFAPSVSIVVNGASAANNYGLKPTRRKR